MLLLSISNYSSHINVFLLWEHAYKSSIFCNVAWALRGVSAFCPSFFFSVYTDAMEKNKERLNLFLIHHVYFLIHTVLFCPAILPLPHFAHI